MLLVMLAPHPARRRLPCRRHRERRPVLALRRPGLDPGVHVRLPDSAGARSAPMSHPVSAPAPSPALYLHVFGVLTLLTVAEIGVVYVPGRRPRAADPALVLLAVAKAALVLLYFMHLRDESRGLQADGDRAVRPARAVRGGADGRGDLAHRGGCCGDRVARRTGAGRWRRWRCCRHPGAGGRPGLSLLRRAGRARAGRRCWAWADDRSPPTSSPLVAIRVIRRLDHELSSHAMDLVSCSPCRPMPRSTAGAWTG